MYYTLDVPQWAAVLDRSDIPHDFKLSFGGFTAVAVSLVLPWKYSEQIVTYIADHVLYPPSREFYVNKYLPELKEAVKNVHVPILDKLRITQKGLGLILKIAYAFLY